MANGESEDSWGNHADEYKNGIERVSERGALDIVNWVHATLPFTKTGSSSFDDGCGSGAVSRLVKEKAPDIPHLAADASPGMVETVLELSKQKKWKNFEAKVQDACNLEGIPDNSFTHALTTYMIGFASEPDRVAAELYRVTKPGGILGLAFWGDPNWNVGSAWEYATRQVKPGYIVPKTISVSWTSSKNIKRNLEKVGFEAVEYREVTHPWSWDSLDALLEYLVHGNHPLALYLFDLFELETDISRDKVIPHLKQGFANICDGEGSVSVQIDTVLVIARKK